MVSEMRILLGESAFTGDAFFVAANDASVLSKGKADVVCDGTADDVQIQTAIDGLSSGGGKVILSEGTFSITSAINISKSKVTIEGQGRATVIKIASGSSIHAFTNTASITDIIIRDLAIDGSVGSGSSSIGRAVYILTANRVVVSDLYVHEMYLSGIALDICNDILIVNNHVVDSGRGNNSPNIAVQQCLRGIISNNISDGGAQTDECIELNAPTAPQANKQIVVIGNVCRDAVQEGVDFTGYNEDIVIIGNTVFSCAIGVTTGSNGMVISNSFFACGTGIKADTRTDVTILGNVVTESTARGILIEDCDRFVCSDNKIYKAADWGIDIVNSDYGTITGNHVMNSDQDSNGRSGISLRGTSSYNSVSGNNCSDDQGTATQNYGITEEDTADNNLIEGNICAGNQVGGIAKVGASSIIRNNLGYITENSGTSSVASGDTTKVVAHGLDVTPTVIHIEFREQADNDYGRWWISSIGATNFTLNVSGDPGASNLDFAWEAKVR